MILIIISTPSPIATCTLMIMLMMMPSISIWITKSPMIMLMIPSLTLMLIITMPMIMLAPLMPHHIIDRADPINSIGVHHITREHNKDTTLPPLLTNMVWATMQHLSQSFYMHIPPILNHLTHVIKLTWQSNMMWSTLTSPNLVRRQVSKYGANKEWMQALKK